MTAPAAIDERDGPAIADPAPATPQPPGRLRPWVVEHRPLLAVLALGLVLRTLVTMAFSPSLMMSDAPRYLEVLDSTTPPPERVVGYSLVVLYPVSRFTEDLVAVTTVQHLLGMVTGVLLYVLLRRRGVGRRLAALATVPVLLDAMQLVLEHAPLSDTTFLLFVTASMLVLCWHPRPTLALAVVAGLLLGTSTTIRQAGLPLVAGGAGFCLLLGRDWRGRLSVAAALVLAFAVPVGGYATWYHGENGSFALSEIGGRASYMRTTSFVDCSRLTLADHQQVLCPPEARGERRDPTHYGWASGSTVRSLDPPAGTTEEEALSDFARQAMRAQPVDYAAIVARDIALGFDVSRGDRFEYDTARKWKFSNYVDRVPNGWTGPAYEAHGGEQPRTHQPWADILVGYQRFGYVPGPVLLGCLVLGLVGGLARRRVPVEDRGACLLLALSGFGLVLVPAVTTQFVWRYQLPTLVLLPGAAALAASALLRHRRGDGTLATPRTD